MWFPVTTTSTGCTRDMLRLKIYSLFIWDSNWAGSAAFLCPEAHNTSLQLVCSLVGIVKHILAALCDHHTAAGTNWSINDNENNGPGISLVVQWLRLQAPNEEGLGSIPGQGTRSHRPQLRVYMLQLKILHAQGKLKIQCAATKTWCRQINKII